MAQGLYVFVPAFNEEKTLREVLRDLIALKHEGMIQGICVVDDGSTDRTEKIVERYSGEIEVIRHKRNRGKGWSFYKAARWARKQGAEFFGMFDADLKGVSKEQLSSLKSEIKRSGVEMVIANTYSGMDLELPWLSGQRIIRMSALKPLFIGNRAWVRMISGIEKKRTAKGRRIPYERVGYGLEEALNYLIGHGKAQKEVLDAPNIKISKTHFFAGPMAIHGKGWERHDRLLDETYDMGKFIERRREKARDKRAERKSKLSQETIARNKKALAGALRHRKPR